METFDPLPQYRPGSVVAAVCAVVCGLVGLSAPIAWIAAGLFVASASLLYYLSARPTVSVGQHYLAIGDNSIRWREIREIRTTGWHSPLVLRLELADGRRLTVVHPGDVRSSQRLLQCIRKYSAEATIDGMSHDEFWGDAPIQVSKREVRAPRPPLLREDDEREVEEIFEKLRSSSRADKTASSDDLLES